MIAQIEGFVSVEAIEPEVASGQYRFNVGGQDRYVVWGSGAANLGISGSVKVVAIDGTESVMDASALQPADAPVFVFSAQVPAAPVWTMFVLLVMLAPLRWHRRR